MRDPRLTAVLWVRRKVRALLGVDAEIAQLTTALELATASFANQAAGFARVVEQLNRTTYGAADTAERLHYYEEHVESIRFHAGRLKAAKAAGVKPNGAGLIHLLGDPG